MAVVQHGHFTRAAAALGVSQPALTKRIGRLERQLGGPLFERHTRGARPTAAGELLAGRARTLLDEARQAEFVTRRALAGETGLLRLGAGSSLLLSGLPEVIHEFRRRHPAVQVTVRDLSTPAQAAALRAGELDAAFLRSGPETRGFQTWPVFQEQLRLAVPRDASRGPESRWFAQPLITIAREVSATFHDHVLATARAIGYAPPVVQETGQLLTVLTLVQAGLGISLVPGSLATLRLPGVSFPERTLPGGTWTIALACRREAAGTPALAPFVRLARERWR